MTHPRTAALRGYAVHLLTATGAVLAMLAMLAAIDGQWAVMYLWLVIAFAVDGIDGPLARRVEVTRTAPRIDGVLLDLIIDYLTYVFIPAFALYASGLLAGWTGWLALIVVTYTSALYFADSRMKMADNSFSGFPAAWNMLVLVLFATEPGQITIVALVMLLAAAMFVPVKFIHPWRTRRWRALSLPVAFVWTAAAGWEAMAGFAAPLPVKAVLTATSLWLVAAGALQQLLPAKSD